MKDFIKECRIPDMEEGNKLGDSPLTQEEDDEERRNAHTIVGRSPFTYEFRKVMEESSTDVKNSSNDPTSKGSKPATEVIECYIRGILNLKDNAGRLYHLDHYTMGVILHGTRVQMARQELKKMRRNRLGKEDWVSIKWQPGKISHTFQKDATSCGAFVMQMAKMTVKEFPRIPQTFHINSSKQSLQNLRRDMAEEILKGSVSKDDFCSFCGIEDLPTTAVDAVWRYQDLGRRLGTPDFESEGLKDGGDLLQIPINTHRAKIKGEQKPVVYCQHSA
ncbi:hypothetical protein NQZ68_000957 [Dissostichus eleginoides]|nr:hypothetical protein NQZ68_000957 [Dissostichus eleginoides]